MAKHGETLAHRIESLQAQREVHARALAEIDSKLEGISALLGNGAVHKASSPGFPVHPVPAARRRGRGHFPLSAEQSIIEFVKKQGNPTTQEINRHLKSEGRSSTADNALSKLVKERRLKRTALGKGIRGSRYTLP